MMKQGITGAILAGGRSTRMGQEKALLEMDGEAFLLRIADVLTEVCESVIVIGDQWLQDSSLALPAFGDVFQNCGPLGGIHSALTHSNTDQVFIAACDLPLISGDVVRYLLNKKTNSAEIIVAAYEDTVQPLLGVYDKSCLQALTDSLAHGERKVFRFLEQSRTEIIRLETSSPPFPPQILTNINTPEEYATALMALKSAKGATS